jgi:hypothetical protein
LGCHTAACTSLAAPRRNSQAWRLATDIPHCLGTQPTTYTHAHIHTLPATPEQGTSLHALVRRTLYGLPGSCNRVGLVLLVLGVRGECCVCLQCLFKHYRSGGQWTTTCLSCTPVLLVSSSMCSPGFSLHHHECHPPAGDHVRLWCWSCLLPGCGCYGTCHVLTHARLFMCLNVSSSPRLQVDKAFQYLERASAASPAAPDVRYEVSVSWAGSDTRRNARGVYMREPKDTASTRNFSCTINPVLHEVGGATWAHLGHTRACTYTRTCTHNSCTCAVCGSPSSCMYVWLLTGMLTVGLLSPAPHLVP